MPRQQEQAFSYISSDDIYASLILEEAEKLYNGLTTKLTNSVIAPATAIMASSLPSLNQKDNRLQVIISNYVFKYLVSDII